MGDLAKLDDPRSWLMLVMRRVFIDQTRRYDKSHVESFDIDGAPEAQSDLPGPEEEADRLKHTERLDRAWQHLSTDQRNLLSLHDLEGHSLAELQEMTGLKEGTLKSRLHRARIKLGRLLQAQQSPTAMRI